MSAGLHRRHQHSEPQAASETHVEVYREDSSLLCGQETDDELSRPLIHRSSDDDAPPPRQASSSSSSKWNAFRETAVGVACGFMDLLPQPIQSKFIPQVPPDQLRFLDSWRSSRLVGEPFSKENTAHMAQLEMFWQLCFAATSTTPTTTPDFSVAMPATSTTTANNMPSTTGVKSEEWKKFGFQGVDPSTDFRGGGSFSLENLAFLAKRYPRMFKEFVHREDYPFAVCGINMTLILVTLLQLQTTQNCLATWKHDDDRYSQAQARCAVSKWIYRAAMHHNSMRFNEQHAEASKMFEEVYCLGCAVVHEEWLKSNRNLMAFNSVLKEGVKRLVDILKVSENIDEAKRRTTLSWE